MPPTAVMPEMALVTDMSGECSAGRTPLTAWKPASPASEKVVSMALSLGSDESPARRSSEERSAKATASLAYFLQAGGGTTTAAAALGGGGGGASYGGAG